MQFARSKLSFTLFLPSLHGLQFKVEQNVGTHNSNYDKLNLLASLVLMFTYNLM